MNKITQRGKREKVSNLDKEKKAHEKEVKIFETAEIITTHVYKVSPVQKEKLVRLAEERLEKAREEAIPKIRQRYEQRVKLQQERRQPQQPKNHGKSSPPQQSNNEDGR
ncbi:hypothetical protein ACI5FR_07860 [Paenibacillus sp. HJGM_3]